MKHSLIVLAALALTLSGCKEEKKSTDIITQKPIIVKKQGPQAMEDSRVSEAAPWLGKTYTVEISRRADRSLPLAKDESGAEYYDNRVQVKVIRPDGTVFFDREYTKQAFRELLSDNDYRDGALLAIVYDEVQDDRLVLAASVGSPDAMSEEYVPFRIVITRMGDVKIERDNRSDEVPEDVRRSTDNEEEEEEGV